MAVIDSRYNKPLPNTWVDIPEEAFALQASYTILGVDAGDTYKREIEALKKLNAFSPLKRMVIVTNDEETTISLGNGQFIEVISAWKWLLE